MAHLKQGDRKFYDFQNVHATSKESFGGDPSTLSNYIRDNIVGHGQCFKGPFGRRPIVYCDYIASGKSLKFIEEFISKEVLSHYGNTHTTTSITSLQTTLYRHEARDIIRNSVNASEHDAVLFTGHGCTGAVHKLVHALQPFLSNKKVVVLASIFEHHSNLLPWRESGAQVILIEETAEGTIDIRHLERELQKLKNSDHKIIGTFCAASNITGQLNDDLLITAMLHKYDALAFWDYATAAPYVTIDMNPKPPGDDSGLCRKDAIFFSMHKFVGGVQTPGILVVKKEILNQGTGPAGGGGGGTVFFVTEDDHRFLKEAELREEGGTPAIVESIRAGLVMQLKKAVGEDFIMTREIELMNRARDRLENLENLLLLGNGLKTSKSRRHLSVLSFVIRAPSDGGFLHHNFVCALLNDLFGIQARGGCACSGPYAQRLLGLSQDLSHSYEKLLLEDERLDRVHLRRGHSEYSQFEILRPGFCRLNLPWFSSDEVIDFVLDALEFVAVEGWKFMPQYIFNNETGEWKHHTDQVFKERKWLGNISYRNGTFQFGQDVQGEEAEGGLPSFEQVLSEAKTLASIAPKIAQKMSVPSQTVLFSEVENLRWIILPSEIKDMLRNPEKPKPQIKVLFEPKVYSAIEDDGPSGSYHGKSVTFNSTLIGQTKPFKLRTWFDDSGLKDITPSNQAKVEKVQVESNSVVCETQNGETICVLPRGQRSEPPEPLKVKTRWRPPTRDIFKPFLEAMEMYDMIKDGDKVLVCLSGGKDSLTLLHTMRQYQFYALKSNNVRFELGAMTVDPQSAAYDPRPLIPYLAELGLQYLYEEQNIMEQAKASNCSSICAFCSRMKRGRMYAAARREGFNVLALGQHLDDLSESFLMSVFHNGRLRTMKANYTVKEGDLRVIRPFVFVREKQLRDFAESQHLPVIAENCPACFEMPKERHRTKQVLAQQELLFPKLYWSLKTAMHPLMSVRETGLENLLFGKNKEQNPTEQLPSDEDD